MISRHYVEMEGFAMNRMNGFNTGALIGAMISVFYLHVYNKSQEKLKR